MLLVVLGDRRAADQMPVILAAARDDDASVRVAAAAAISGIGGARAAGPEPDNRVTACVFSKHLQFLDYEEVGKTAKNMGFDGIDLTVRPRGHVLPERVEDDLPRAVQASN